ncbi:hypothetical protein PR202_gb26785 [Eleusine coracana subsp. coracana]|uniref:Geranylgeranyl diphosphate synthase n=1 Tax=Eleusine coracana subsp. coracana TaxID=191504 RepID=A0AAV5FS16_ELECO|nr:hypothetical protein PR202_gb26785 [Eleusine coracana subsp. coracana]
MDKLASCLPQHGATSSQSFKLSTTLHRLTPGPRRTRPVSTVRCAPSSHAGIATAAIIATARDTQTHRYDDVNGVSSSSSFDFERYLSRNAEAVHAALDAALTGLGCPSLLADSMRYSVLGGGKLVRPVLSIACCELVGGRLPRPRCPAWTTTRSAAASPPATRPSASTRPSSPATRSSPSPSSTWRAHPPATSAPTRTARSAPSLSGIAAGQVADKAGEGDDVTASLGLGLAGLEYIHVHKTARLVEAAAVCGAVVGGGGGGEVERVRRYARRVGLLLQVVDDVLDVTRSSEQLGKTAGKDVTAGKATYPRLMGVEKARAYAGELLARAEAELDGFDAQRAAPLRHLAQFVAYRQH